MVAGLHGNKSSYSDRLTPLFQSLKMMYDYWLNLAVRTPRACPWIQSVKDYTSLYGDIVAYTGNGGVVNSYEEDFRHYLNREVVHFWCNPVDRQVFIKIK